MERLHVVVVEDDADFLTVLCEWLARDRTWHAPRCAGDGEEAMAVVSDGVVPNLVLLDLELPKLHGMDVLRHLRNDARFRRTAVIVIGANGDPGLEREKFLPGEVWLPKPFHVDDLATAVNLAISRLVESCFVCAEGRHLAEVGEER